MNYIKVAQTINDAIKQVVEKKFNNFPLHEPEFNNIELKFTNECLKTGWISTNGEFINKFRKSLKNLTKSKNILLLNSGTSALHLCLKTLNIKENDEVLVPGLTFVATVNAIKYCNANPHFIDSDFETLGVDTKKLKEYLLKNTRKTKKGLKNLKTGNFIKALVVTHVYGYPAKLNELINITKYFKIHLIEDAAEALGSYYKKKHVGNFGIMSALSFNGNKIITTGAGGAILTKNENLYKKAKHLAAVAKNENRIDFYHDNIGFNYKMANINAAIGFAQMKKINNFLKRKRKLANLYKDFFFKIENIDFFDEPINTRSNYWLNIIFLKTNSIKIRNRILSKLKKNKIYCRPIWFPINKLPMYKKCPSMNLNNLEKINKNLICLPSSPILIGKSE